MTKRRSEAPPPRGRTVVLTGASSGIGLAIRDRLLAAGHSVIGIARRTPAAPVSGLSSIALDLGAMSGLVSRVRRALADLPPPDALVSCAGAGTFGNLEQLAEGAIRKQIDLNLTGHVLVTQAVLPSLKTHAASHVVFIGSESALRGGRRGSVYCAAKFGLRGFAQALRAECSSSGVHVSIVHPGMTRTPFFDELDFAPGEDPENAVEAGDVADVVVQILAARPGTVIDEVEITPLKKVVRHRQPDSKDA